MSSALPLRGAAAAAHEGDRREAELLSAAYHLVMAGFDTTVNLIASGTLALLTQPEEMARLRQDPSLLPAAVEELLRVLIATSSADRDPAQFPDPGPPRHRPRLRRPRRLRSRHPLLPGRSPGPNGG
jgi:hypothetical protein